MTSLHTDTHEILSQVYESDDDWCPRAVRPVRGAVCERGVPATAERRGRRGGKGQRGPGTGAGVEAGVGAIAGE